MIAPVTKRIVVYVAASMVFCPNASLFNSELDANAIMVNVVRKVVWSEDGFMD